MKRNWIFLITLTTLIAILLPFNLLYASPGLLGNEDFETGDFTDWTIDIDPSHSSNDVIIASEDAGTNYYTEIYSYVGSQTISQQIPISSPYIYLSYDVRSNTGTYIDSHFHKVSYLDSGGNPIATRTRDYDTAYQSWTTIESDIMSDAGFPSSLLVNAVAVEITIGVSNYEAQPAIMDFDNVVLTYIQEEQEEITEESEATSDQMIPEPSKRNMPMTCWQVWINEDNNFEFIFLWEYANNNWVRIYDMDDNLVWQKDFKYGEPRFEADLPDGMYMVRTYHDGFENPIQEFVIGKP